MYELLFLILFLCGIIPALLLGLAITRVVLKARRAERAMALEARAPELLEAASAMAARLEGRGAIEVAFEFEPERFARHCAVRIKLAGRNGLPKGLSCEPFVPQGAVSKSKARSVRMLYRAPEHLVRLDVSPFDVQLALFGHESLWAVWEELRLRPWIAWARLDLCSRSQDVTCVFHVSIEAWLDKKKRGPEAARQHEPSAHVELALGALIQRCAALDPAAAGEDELSRWLAAIGLVLSAARRDKDVMLAHLFERFSEDHSALKMLYLELIARGDTEALLKALDQDPERLEALMTSDQKLRLACQAVQLARYASARPFAEGFGALLPADALRPDWKLPLTHRAALWQAWLDDPQRRQGALDEVSKLSKRQQQQLRDALDDPTGLLGALTHAHSPQGGDLSLD